MRKNEAGEYFRKAFNLTVEAAARMNGDGSAEARQGILHHSVRYALNCGEASEARRLLAIAGRTGEVRQPALKNGSNFTTCTLPGWIAG